MHCNSYLAHKNIFSALARPLSPSLRIPSDYAYRVEARVPWCFGPAATGIGAGIGSSAAGRKHPHRRPQTEALDPLSRGETGGA